MIQVKNELFASLLYLNQELNFNYFIEGAIKIQKLTFLAQNFLHNISNDVKYDFIAHDYGPYSLDLRADLEFEERSGVLEINRNTILDLSKHIEEKQENRSKNRRYDYRLTLKGRAILYKRIQNYSPFNKYILYGLRNLGFMDSRHLISIVYQLYPKMANKSKIKPIIEKIPEDEIKAGIKFFFRAFPQKVLTYIYNLNQNFSNLLPNLEDELSCQIGKNDANKEIPIIRKVISKNIDFLEILAKY